MRNSLAFCSRAATCSADGGVFWDATALKVSQSIRNSARRRVISVAASTYRDHALEKPNARSRPRRPPAAPTRTVAHNPVAHHAGCWFFWYFDRSSIATGTRPAETVRTTDAAWMKRDARALGPFSAQYQSVADLAALSTSRS